MKWLLRTYMCKQHIESLSELADRTGMTRRLLYDRINNPSTFRIFELMALDEVLKFSDEDLMLLIRGKG